MNKPLSRAEVALEDTWNLLDLFATRGQWQHELAAIERDAATITAHQGHLAEGSARLMVCLDALDALLVRLDRAQTWAYLRLAEDGTDATHQADQSLSESVGARVRAAVNFVDTEVLSLPEGTLHRWLAEQPALGAHHPLLENLLRRKPHMLSAETERVLASLGEVLDAPYTVYARSKTGDVQFAPFTAAGREHPNSFNLYEWTYETAPQPDVRRAAWASFCSGLKPYQNTQAATFATEMNKNIVLAKARGFPSAEQFLLHDHKVSFDLYTNILDTIQAELAPHMQRLARLRKRVLGLSELLYCDIKAPLDAGYEPEMSFDEAADLILKAVAPMGPDYAALMRAAFAQRWVDRANNAGKASGAFCASPYGAHPYILMTWTGSMHDAFVLAHELGHAGHFAIAQRHQRLVGTWAAMPFIEAPSIMNEVLLARQILQGCTDTRMRRWVVLQVLGTYHHNFVTHLLEAELQRQTYRLAEGGTPVTATLLNERKAAILKNFWGDTVTIDEGAAMTWMRQPHYYMGLYPYTYSVGLVAATALAEKARAEGDGVFAGWLKVLAAGGSMAPLELMQQVGIDLSTKQPIVDAVGYVGRLVDELEGSF